MPQRVLIVEDEALIALDLAQSLEAMGHEVVAIAADSAAAREAAPEGIDLALVDLNLRDGPTGPALGEELAQDWGATVIYLTANPRQVEIGVSGPVGILPKPFTDAALWEVVRFALSIRHGRLAAPPVGLRLLSGAPPSVEGIGREPRL